MESWLREACWILVNLFGDLIDWVRSGSRVTRLELEGARLVLSLGPVSVWQVSG